MTDSNPQYVPTNGRAGRRAVWPDRLIELGTMRRASSTDRREAQSELWLLLGTVLRQRIRAEVTRTGPIDNEDLEDLAADKALDLMIMIDGGRWDLQGASRERVIAFISTVARNGLVDFLRRQNRRTQLEEVDVATFGSPALQPKIVLPDVAAERAGFVDALVQCVGGLKPHHARVWFFRVFLEMPSKRIASHPDVQLKASHVDVTLQRTRARIRECVEAKGFRAHEMPQGTFTALWRAFHMDERHFAREIGDV